MRLQITYLKAPWPEGAVVGDVLDLPTIPAWALGKCKRVADNFPVTIVQGDGSGEKLPEADGEQKTDGQDSVSAESSESDGDKEKPRRGRPPKAE